MTPLVAAPARPGRRVGRRVRFRREFARDLRDQVRWLDENRGIEQVERLRTGLDEAIELLARFPGIGPAEAKDDEDRAVVRRLLLRKLPYVIWYLVDASGRDGDLWLLRLFHARQQRPLAGAGLPSRKPRTR
ncbi:type II toxin-antitoxin system RelE/ParE family toxin [Sorangium sp. So ce363]|uniref:type II toxin-antitoxin system RelE/ParE family toxin n=1 Tax=Sorangium sp. So ce363 TaxID=3133304 RepID=UPI003F5E7A08